MKKRTFAILMLSPALVLLTSCSQTGPGAKNPVDELVTLCKNDNYKEAAKHLVYDGDDASKKNQPSNYEQDDAKSKGRVEGNCKRFKSMASMSYTVGAEEVRTQGDKTRKK